MTYLRERMAERTTWAYLGIALACALVFWYYQGQIYTHIVAAFSLFRAAAKDRIERRMLDWLRSRLTKPAVPGASLEVPVSDIVKTLEAGALAAFKAVPLPAPYGALVAAVISAVENPTVPNVLTAIGDVIAIAQTLEETVPVGAVTPEAMAS